MDTAGALEQLNKFLDLTVPHNGSGNGVITTDAFAAAPRNEVLAQWAVVQLVLTEVHPAWEGEAVLHPSFEFGQRRDAAITATALLERQAEIEAHLRPAGPQLNANDFHPWIWTDAVRHRWDLGQHDDAVLAASRELNEQLRRLIGSYDLSEVKLVNELISDRAPTPGRSRLTAPKSLDAQSRSNGA